MEEKKKHKVMIGIEVILLGMIIAIVGTNAASSNPPSNGVSYSKNSQTTVEGALNDLYNKANYGNAGAGDILSGKTALVGGKQVTGTIVDRTNDTGTIGLAWSTSNYQTVGNQLRIGVNKGYYGTNNYSNWGTSGIVFDDYQKKLGITADKILKGQSIAGINGTGETSCPTCESQGYWKIKTFRNSLATIDSYQTFDGTWKNLAKYVLSSNSSDRYTSTFKINLKDKLGIEPTEIKDYAVSLSCNEGNEGFRYGRGYASNSATAQYWYTSHFSLTSSNDNLNIWGSLSDDANVHNIDLSSRDGNLEFKFETVRMANSNGTSQSTFQTKCTAFYLSGFIIYK